MSEFSPDSANAEQVEYWNGEGGQGWAERDQQMEKTLGPIADAVIEVAPFQPTMRFGHGVEREQVADFFIDVSPVSRVLDGASPEPGTNVAAASI